MSLPSAEAERYKKTYEKHQQLIETLPRVQGWRQQHIFNYNGFWLGGGAIKGNLLLNAHFISQPSDIFLAAFMKSGTTWLKALMFAAANRHRYTFDDHPLLRRGPQGAFPFIDSSIFDDYPISDFTHLPPPRLFATHFARTLLPPSVTDNCKFVYVCRDPKDVLISKWHFMNRLRSSKELAPLSLNDALELFCHGVSEYGPFWDHVLGYWRASLESPDKILFLKYEEMKKQPTVEVKRLAAFMGMPFTAEEEEKGVAGEIVKLCSFGNLSNLDVNKKGVEKFGRLEVENREFFRKGEIGDWKNYLSEEMKQRIDSITHDKLKGSGLFFGATSPNS